MTAREPPSDTAAEAAVLGAILLDNDALPNVASLTPEDFHREAHRLIWRAMLDLDARQEPIELRTLTDALARTNDLERVGGGAYLIGLTDDAVLSVYADTYARIVREKSALRGIITASAKAMQAAYDATETPNAILENAEAALLALNTGRAAGEGGEPIRQPLMSVFNALSTPKPLVPHVTWGLPDLDRATNGLEPGTLTILAARPSMGKTSLALQVAAFNARRKRSVLFYSLEMSNEQLAARLLASDAKVDLQRLRTRDLNESDYGRLASSMNALIEHPLRVDDDGGLTTSDLRRRSRLVEARHGLDLIVVDYLQLLTDPASRGQNRVAEITTISRGLKRLARELDVPIIALSQLSRALESRPDKRPILSDLRESGAIEQDADLVAFIYRDEYYDPNSAARGVAEVHLAKQRNGPTRTVRLSWFERTTTFTSASTREYSEADIMTELQARA